MAGIDATIEQSDTAIVGNSTNSCCTHSFTGRVGDPRVVMLDVRFSGCPTEGRSFVGTVDADLNTIKLEGPNCNVPSTTFAFIRK